MGKLDVEKFNTDPKHEETRQTLDAMVESSVKRIVDKKKKAKDPDTNIFDEVFGGIFGGEEK